jgi:hypothetical protein
VTGNALRIALIALIALLPLVPAGCQRYVATTTQPATSVVGLVESEPNLEVEAIVSPPAGWRKDPLKNSSRHAHQVWVSPTGDTAYGVIRARLPLPVGADLALMGFMAEMRRSEGEGILISRDYDHDLPGLRFIAEGGPYRIHANLTTHGFATWTVYAGVLRGRPVNEAEFELAARAREATIIGLPALSSSE